MKIKTKVTIGVAILVVLIIAQGMICNFFLYRFSDASKQILKDNYTTVGYCKEMIQALDNIHQSYIFFEFTPQDTTLKRLSPDYKKGMQQFERILKAEENNITEPREKEEVESLRASYEEYVKMVDQAKAANPQQYVHYLTQLTIQYGRIKNSIISIWNINMDAITRKNDLAEEASQQASLYISLIEIITSILVVPILFLFPSYIANPIKEIKERIRDIANRNYNQRIIIKRKDEIGELAEEFNKMTEKLQEYQRHS